MNNKKITNINKKGFTLVEIMVATSIFMVIMLVAMGSLIVSSDAAKKAKALRSAMNNVNFALESMTRSLRTGTDYACITSGGFILPLDSKADCPLENGEGGIAVAFTPANFDPKNTDRPTNTAFVLNEREDGTSKVLQRCHNGELCVDLVSPEVNIERLTFFVNGSGDDLTQPSVYILIKGSVKIKDEVTTFAVQTNVSQRSAE